MKLDERRSLTQTLIFPKLHAMRIQEEIYIKKNAHRAISLC